MKRYKWVDAPSQNAFPVARAGYRYIFAGAFVTAVLALAHWQILTLLSLVVTGFLCWFFRDPDRVIPVAPDTLVSPADGRIVRAETVADSPLGDGPCLKISVFMSVFNVHVNRLPCAGTVEKILYYPGVFFSANLDKASEKNERNAVIMTTPEGQRLVVMQIAGLVARRIICELQEGQTVEQGQRFGIICLGSRLDLYLPPETKAVVSPGDKVRAGTSILAYLS